MIAVIIIIVAVVVAVAVLAGVVYFVLDSNRRVRRFAHSTDLIPGRPGRAPEEWTTSMAAEAQLHQRIRYAIADVHQAPGARTTDEVRAALSDLDDAVFELDDRLIAAASLPDAGKVGVIDTRVVEPDSDDEPEPDRTELSDKAAEDVDSPRARELRALEQPILILEALPKKIWEEQPADVVADMTATARALRK